VKRAALSPPSFHGSPRHASFSAQALPAACGDSAPQQLLATHEAAGNTQVNQGAPLVSDVRRGSKRPSFGSPHALLAAGAELPSPQLLATQAAAESHQSSHGSKRPSLLGSKRPSLTSMFGDSTSQQPAMQEPAAGETYQSVLGSQLTSFGSGQVFLASAGASAPQQQLATPESLAGGNAQVNQGAPTASDVRHRSKRASFGSAHALFAAGVELPSPQLLVTQAAAESHQSSHGSKRPSLLGSKRPSLTSVFGDSTPQQPAMQEPAAGETYQSVLISQRASFGSGKTLLASADASAYHQLLATQESVAAMHLASHSASEAQVQQAMLQQQAGSHQSTFSEHMQYLDQAKMNRRQQQYGFQIAVQERLSNSPNSLELQVRATSLAPQAPCQDIYIYIYIYVYICIYIYPLAMAPQVPCRDHIPGHSCQMGGWGLVRARGSVRAQPVQG